LDCWHTGHDRANISDSVWLKHGLQMQCSAITLHCNNNNNNNRISIASYGQNFLSHVDMKKHAASKLSSKYAPYQNTYDTTELKNLPNVEINKTAANRIYETLTLFSADHICNKTNIVLVISSRCWNLLPCVFTHRPRLSKSNGNGKG